MSRKVYSVACRDWCVGVAGGQRSIRLVVLRGLHFGWLSCRANFFPTFFFFGHDKNHHNPSMGGFSRPAVQYYALRKMVMSLLSSLSLAVSRCKLSN